MSMRSALCALAALVLLGGGGAATRAEELPPPPAAWFNDYAGVVDPADARRLDQKLRRLEDETSTQVVVVVFPRLPSPSLEDFTSRTAESWRVGREELDNGAILFVFVADRKMRIEVGYGLEGALPDALAGRILNERVVPRLRQGDWVGGLEAAIDGILAAVEGEYSSPPPKEPQGPPLSAIVLIIVFIVIFLLLVRYGSPASAGRTYGGRGYRRDRSHWGGGTWSGGGWGGGFGGGGRGGGSWGGGGGGFMGGGGSFGGGGASSSW